MLLRGLIGFVFAGVLVFSAAAADVVIRVRPPHVLVERRGPPPSRNHVWISGYHRYNGNAYAWEHGRWEQPSRPHARWVSHHYVRRNGGWVLVDGHWR
jgi:hypothetical protein